MSNDFQVVGENPAAPFMLKVHRGDGMALLAMNWKDGEPPKDFVGFAIEYREPGGRKFFPLKNRLAFPGPPGTPHPNALSTLLSPIQKFRWIHFPRNAELRGAFVYRVRPVFMNASDELSYGEQQQVAIELRRETYPGQMNVTFTRGFVSSQAFVDRYESKGPIDTLLPKNADEGLDFIPTHPEAEEALAWMGFEARDAVLDVLDAAIQDTSAQVRVVAYDLSEPGVLTRLERLGPRLKIIIDDDGAHGEATSGETQSAARLATSAGAANVRRQHMGKLQHNKTIVVDGAAVKSVICGSTNFTWRGFFVQANNAVVLEGESAVARFMTAFEHYWEKGTVAKFVRTSSSDWQDLGLSGIDARVSFSPRAKEDGTLRGIADDIAATSSSLFYSLAFLFQTPGVILTSINRVTNADDLFVYGISDKEVGGIELQKPDGNVVPVSPAALTRDVPLPFKKEPVGGGGNRMHHKFVVIDFDKPTARVYTGSYNFSVSADVSNGENLVLIRDRRVAVSYMIEALRLFDHYHFRVSQQESRAARRTLTLRLPPRAPGQKPWWDEYYSDPRKVRDRKLFS